MSNPWFRMYAEFSNDPIVQSLSFDDQRHFVVILCLKCQGVLDRNLSEANRERIINRGLGLDSVTANEAKRRLLEVELIDDDWQPLAWDKRQFISDSSAKRTRKYRKNKETNNVTVTGNEASPSVSVSVYEVINNKKSFTPPTKEESIQYFLDNQYTKEAGEKAWEYYDCADWKDSTGKKVKNWKQKMRGVWFKDENKEGYSNGTNTGFNKKETSSDIFAADAESIRNGEGGIW